MGDIYRRLARFIDRNIKINRPAAYLAILDILLLLHRTVDQYVDTFATIGALDRSRLQLVHSRDGYRSMAH